MSKLKELEDSVDSNISHLDVSYHTERRLRSSIRDLVDYWKDQVGEVDQDIKQHGKHLVTDLVRLHKIISRTSLINHLLLHCNEVTARWIIDLARDENCITEYRMTLADEEKEYFYTEPGSEL